MPITFMPWTDDQLKLAFYLYCQLPFGKLHHRNQEIIKLAELIGRTPSAVAMKLCNFASLDPAVTETGRTGLGNASTRDRKVWADFHADWEGLALEAQRLKTCLGDESMVEQRPDSAIDDFEGLSDFSGETRQVLAQQRIKQSFFRRAVLSGYRERCCMSGLADPRLLVASHIVPWSFDKANRLNPSNGLCLSAIHDRAFDKGLITLTDDYRVILARELRERKEAFVEQVFIPIEGRKIELPERFWPDQTFISQHRSSVFLDR
jgi:hypothetical protein